MKLFKRFFALTLVLCLLLVSCTKKDDKKDEPKSEPVSSSAEPSSKVEPEPSPEPEPSGAELSEKAMDSFLKKISQGNYTMAAPDFVTTSVFKDELVWLHYAENMYADLVYMSVNNETFQARINDGKLADVTYVGNGNALTAASSRLVNTWLDASISGGNIFNVFYNQVDAPLDFVSHDENIKNTLLTFAGYGPQALRLMEDVHLVLDSADPKEVHIKAVMNDDEVARMFFDDIDIVITFDDPADNELARAWMKAPVYPDARTEWTDTDKFVFNSVFMTSEAEDVIPFPAFASYAFKMDTENFWVNNMVYMSDAHATEKDMQDYAAYLLEKGYKEANVTGDDGAGYTVYRKVLREEMNAYSQVELEYQNGVNIYGNVFYDNPKYSDLASINKRIEEVGFLPLPENDNIVSIKGEDTASKMTESWLYFYMYEAGLYVDIDCKDQGELIKYLESYIASLEEKGFYPVYEGEDTPAYYKSPNEIMNFRYHIQDEDTINLLFKAEKNIDAAETAARIKKAGYPEIKLTDPTVARDMVKFRRHRYGDDFEFDLVFVQYFATGKDADSFLDAYAEKLEAAGFEKVNPEEAASIKEIAFLNSDKDMVVALDYITQDGGKVMVSFEFKIDRD
ncbi:MAG: hypothetical protein II749_06050 [Clostridia bacterium]|nr:hypothetical protein [Clostridia bacterium]